LDKVLGICSFILYGTMTYDQETVKF